MKITTIQVREIEMNLVSYTRSLELCARMNYETENLDFIDSISKEEVLYDLGACEGRFAIYAALKGVRCYAFEPEQRNFQALLENIEVNQANFKSDLIPLKLALGEYNHEAYIKIAQPWAGGHQKVIADVPSRADLNFNFSEEQRVEVVSLDTIIESKKLPFPNYLKIDIDGSELPFLSGASKTLENERLKKVIFELSQRDENYSFILNKLEEFKFIPDTFHAVPNEPDLFNVVFIRSPHK